MKSILISIITVLLSAVLPYVSLSVILWDYNVGNWNIFARVGLVLWSLAIAGATYTKISKHL